VNPSHLFLGTQKQNLEDMAKKKRSTWGERNPMAKLSKKNIEDIRHLLSTKVSEKSIALKFNVCRQTINNIKNGKVWKDA
jgi:DNA invertase Pin-like site-specific DNA recombinase